MTFDYQCSHITLSGMKKGKTDTGHEAFRPTDTISVSGRIWYYHDCVDVVTRCW